MKKNEEHFLKEVVTESVIECDEEPKVVEAQVMSEREERHLKNLLHLVFFRDTGSKRWKEKLVTIIKRFPSKGNWDPNYSYLGQTVAYQFG